MPIMAGAEFESDEEEEDDDMASSGELKCRLGSPSLLRSSCRRLLLWRLPCSRSNLLRRCRCSARPHCSAPSHAPSHDPLFRPCSSEDDSEDSEEEGGAGRPRRTVTIEDVTVRGREGERREGGAEVQRRAERSGHERHRKHGTSQRSCCCSLSRPPHSCLAPSPLQDQENGRGGRARLALPAPASGKAAVFEDGDVSASDEEDDEEYSEEEGEGAFWAALLSRRCCLLSRCWV